MKLHPDNRNGPASIDRRNLIKALVAAPLACGLPMVASASTPLVRYDAASAAGREMLAIYADAVTRMQALGDNNPMGWLWQWYEHFVDGTTSKSAEITRIFGSAPSAARTLAGQTWDTCQSHSGQNANNFLPWHRLFVWYFERIVRQVSGRADFTLPYWDYTSSDPAKRGVLPPQFLMPTDPVFHSLYRPERTSLANNGLPIQKYQPGDPMDISAAMAKANYSTIGSVQGFCRAIDSGIHGRIHVLVGTSKGMGSVPYAARDPLFWVHHSNIDRMWTSWNRNGGQNPTTATWATKAFVFADTNGSGATRKLNSAFSASSLGYAYDSYIPPTSSSYLTATSAPALASGLSTTAADRRQTLARAAAGATLGAGPVSVQLARLAGAPRAAVLGLDPAHPQRHAYLVLKDLHAWGQPECCTTSTCGPAMAPARWAKTPMSATSISSMPNSTTTAVARWTKHWARISTVSMSRRSCDASPMRAAARATACW
ncbi:tyrosinase family protein [Cognatiluteimonas telluris]|uniref:tyrosinase family protein n=1 Tax=Cognatiluteimonas telluris TaxID=1104775 RepID=UPI0014094436|nr:tyrosinase family protein [Lysobacter telluris]